MDIKKVCVIGAGVMGHGIALVAARAGLKTAIVETEAHFLDNGLTKIKESVNKFVKSGKMTQNDADHVMGLLQPTLNLEEGAGDADIVIEAVPELLNVKQEVFKKLDSICPSHTILCTNTSQLSITEIASVTGRLEKVIGTHFFAPPQVMKLIEIPRGQKTSDDTLDTVLKMCEKFGKETIVCKDSQGFVTSRVLAAFTLECIRVVEEGLASKEDVDKACKLAFNHPMGAFQLNDFSGLDTALRAYDGLRGEFGDRFLSPQSLRNLVRSGDLGYKSGNGWFSYEGN
jgi:3-hydroxybutyryl-CoA dehydrogenase